MYEILMFVATKVNLFFVVLMCLFFIGVGIYVTEKLHSPEFEEWVIFKIDHIKLLNPNTVYRWYLFVAVALVYVALFVTWESIILITSAMVAHNFEIM